MTGLKSARKIGVLMLNSVFPKHVDAVLSHPYIRLIRQYMSLSVGKIIVTAFRARSTGNTSLIYLQQVDPMIATFMS